MSAPLGALAAVGTALAFALMALPPLFLLPIDAVVFQERFGWRAVLGTVVAVAGVACMFLGGVMAESLAARLISPPPGGTGLRPPS